MEVPYFNITLTIPSLQSIKSESPYVFVLLYGIGIVFSCCLSTVIGIYFISFLRKICKTTEKVWKLTMVVFAAPLLTYTVCTVLAELSYLDRVIADAISFGIVGGILYMLHQKPIGMNSVKIIVQHVQIQKKYEVWFDTMDITIKDFQKIIADSIGVTVNRIEIESGKGNFLDDTSKPLSTIIDDSSKITDFFGFTCASCYISVKEETEDLSARNGEDLDKTGKPTLFAGILKGELKFGDHLNLNAKIPSTAGDSKSFCISLVDKFVAAAPCSTQMPIHSTPSIRILSASLLNTSHLLNGESGSDIGEIEGPDSHHEQNHSAVSGSRGGLNFFRRKPSEDATLGQPIRNGDRVILECVGKYMSVNSGWWMAWHSPAPRRSGIFVIDIIERCSQNKITEALKEQFGNFKQIMHRGSAAALNNNNINQNNNNYSHLSSTTNSNALNSTEKDNILRPGDVFKLRSLKFPDYELGITSVKLKDDYCYLGLRKYHGNLDAHESNWCLEVGFFAKSKAITTDIISKIPY